MYKIDVVSGFLGAGKTTLISKLLKEVFKGQKVVLVENEFGEIGIDGSFLKETGVQINEINSGCICCTLKGDFQKALRQVIDTYHPDHILIEPSGVGKLSDILRIVKSVDGTELDSYSTVVDAARCKIYHRNFREFFDDQIATASCVILSKTQNTDEQKLAEDTAIIRGLNPKARIITTPWDSLSGQAIFEAMKGSSDGFPAGLGELADDEDDEEEEEEHEHEHEHEEEHDHDEREHHHHHHHHGEHDADEVFDSIGMETVTRYDAGQLKEILNQLGDNIIRAKGIVPDNNGGWLFFDYVPGESDVRKGTPAVTGLITVIGEHVDEAAMKALFQVK